MKSTDWRAFNVCVAIFVRNKRQFSGTGGVISEKRLDFIDFQGNCLLPIIVSLLLCLSSRHVICCVCENNLFSGGGHQNDAQYKFGRTIGLLSLRRIYIPKVISLVID